MKRTQSKIGTLRFRQSIESSLTKEKLLLIKCLSDKSRFDMVQLIHLLASSFSSLEISCQSVRLFVSLEMTLILISLCFYIYICLYVCFSFRIVFSSYSSITSSRFDLIESIERRRRATSILMRAEKKGKSNTFVKKKTSNRRRET